MNMVFISAGDEAASQDGWNTSSHCSDSLNHGGTIASDMIEAVEVAVELTVENGTARERIVLG